jgi:hypothetical protein
MNFLTLYILRLLVSQNKDLYYRNKSLPANGNPNIVDVLRVEFNSKAYENICSHVGFTKNFRRKGLVSYKK